MDIIIRNSSDKPIYEQIASQIKSLIIGGELKTGDPLPSMRLLAKELRLSVITTKRAYAELERDGFIDSVTGKGSFVSLRKPDLIREEQLRIIEGHLEKAVDAARASGVGLSELVEMAAAIYGGDE